MAKPDTDDGWYKLSHELDAALAVADFRKGERVILREVFAQVFGKAKRRTAILSPVEIARRCGIVASNVSHSITGLVSGNVLARISDGSYRFLKDYEAWTYKGQPRLSKEEIVYAKSAVKSALESNSTTTVEIVSNGTSHKPNDSVQLDTIQDAIVSNETRHRVQPDTEIVSNGTRPDSAPLEPPHGNAGAEFKTNETYETEFASDRTKGRQETIPFRPTPKLPSEPISEPETFNPSADVRAVADLAERLFPLRDFGSKVWDLEANLDMAVLEASLYDAKIAGKSRWDYIDGIYRNRCADGRMAKMANPDQRSVLKRQSPSTRPPLITPEIRAMIDERDAILAARRAAQ